jgi:hypothetical protein
MSDAGTGSFRTAGIAGEHYDLRSLLRKKLGDCFADPHGRTCNHRNFARKFHAGFVS